MSTKHTGIVLQGLFILFLFFTFRSLGSAQCTTGVLYVTGAAPSCVGTPQNIAGCQYAGEYSTVPLTAGVTYTFTSSIATDYITVATNPGNVPQAWGTQPVVFTPAVSAVFRIYTHTNAGCGTMNSCRNLMVQCGTPPPPPNDNPCAATPLTVGASCSYSFFSNASATNSPGVPAPGCAGYSGGDVWFTVTVPVSGNLNFDTQTGVMLDGGMAVYSGTCGALSLIACDDNTSANGNMPALSLTGLTPGATLWIRVWENGNDNNGTFGICVVNPNPPNDNPCNATALPVGISCTYTNSTNAGGTASPGVPAPGCAGYSGGDVWFTVTVPASGDLNFDTQTGVMLDGGMAVYSGTCASLTLLGCDDNSSANGQMPALSLTGLTPGATLWIRVWESGNNNNGTFGICAVDPNPPPNPGDCPNAINLCSASSSFNITPSGFGNVLEFGTGTTSNPSTNPNCCNSGCLLTGEANSTWLIINIQTSGMLQFSFGAPGGAGCYDWNMWGPYTASTCASIASNSLAPIACNWNGGCNQFTGMANPVPAGGFANSFEQPIAVTAGQQYVVCFSNYSSLTTSVPFNSLGSATVGCGPLPVELESFYCSQKGNRMSIDWTTASEINNNYFVVERSFDGNNFESIGTVVGSGNSNTSLKYSFMDNSPQQGINYYRLKQVDYDGENETFGISSCEFEPNHNASTVNIYNMTGQIILSLESMDYKYDINSLILPTGMYMIQVITGNDVIHQTHFHGSGGGHWYGN